MKSLAELKAIRDRMQGQVGMRGEDASQTRVVCRHGDLRHCSRSKTCTFKIIRRSSEKTA